MELRERFAVARGEADRAVRALTTGGRVAEAVLLSTCNRTELYMSTPDVRTGTAAAREWLADRVDALPADLDEVVYERRDRGAVGHLFRVAGGLDSMVLGEAQIQGQVREAYESSRDVPDAVGPALNRLFQTALGVGGRIRSETAVGLGAASVPSAAVDLSKKIFGSLKGRRALILGAGEMSEVTLECLRSEGVRAAVVANRTYERAVELAARWDSEAIRLDAIDEALPTVDIVISSTSAPHLVLTAERFHRALRDGPDRPLCIIDIAIPRDVDPAIGEETNVFLYNVDDLRQIVDDSLGRRQAEMPRAESLVSEGVEEFWSWYSTLEVVPTIRDLRLRAERVRREEVERVLRRLRHLGPDDREAIDVLTRALMNKVLHSPTVRMREAVGNGRGTAVLDTVRYLFELDHEEVNDED